MPDHTNRTPMQLAWINFTDSVKVLLVPQIDDRPLDQYLEFRDKVFGIVREEQFLMELEQTWAQTDHPDNQITETLLLEIQAFPRAIEVGLATEPKEEPKKWLPKWLDRAGIVTGSVSDILTDLPSYAKGGLTLFKEVIDLFKGKN